MNEEDQWTHADGRAKDYATRKAERTAADRQRQRDDQAAKQQAKREAQYAPPAPPPPTFAERQAQRRATDAGKKQAEERAAPPADPNVYRKLAKEYENRQYTPEYKGRYERFTKLADEWDQKQLALAEAAAKQAAIDADPSVRLARDYSAGLMKITATLPEEFGVAAAECVGIADAGDAELAWQHMRELDEKIWRHHDKIAAEKLVSKNATDAEFRDAANTAELARERAEQSAANAKGDTDD